MNKRLIVTIVLCSILLSACTSGQALRKPVSRNYNEEQNVNQFPNIKVFFSERIPEGEIIVNNTVYGNFNISNDGMVVAPSSILQITYEQASGREYELITIPQLKTGESTMVYGAHLFDEQGISRIIASADYDNQISEINEYDNDKDITFIVQSDPDERADLALVDIKAFPTNPSMTEEAIIQYTIKNKGKGISAETIFQAQYYPLHTSNITGHEFTIEEIHIGETKNVNRTISFTNSSGEWIIGGLADYYNIISEIDEDNNRLELHILVIESKTPD